MKHSELPITGAESAQQYLDEEFNRSEWQTGGPFNAHVIEPGGRLIGDFTRNARPRSEQQASAARAALSKEVLEGVPSALLECLNRGDLLTALRYLGRPIEVRDGGLCYFDDGEWMGLGADTAAVERVMGIINALPVPEDVLDPPAPVQRSAA